MIDPSKVVSIHPYFKVPSGKLEEARAMLREFIAKVETETGNLYYDFTINGDVIFCREGYQGAQALLDHCENVADELGRFLELVEVVRVEVHGTAGELDKLREPLADLNPEWFEFECGATH